MCTGNIINAYSKMVHIHKEGNEPCFIYTIQFDCIISPLNENNVKTEGIQITIYRLMSSISLDKYCCFL